ncbi:MAG: hypothetical protein A4E53_00333 [Pelotomaculum sp. PtaB.Bin104]|nr:MAG: hypothetical protein A4E53_00333 [Pelotomaculum sp. PtaB.Bin104]
MFKKFIKALHKDENGQSFIEYGLVLILVTLALVVSTRSLATDGIGPKYTSIKTELQNVTVPSLN